VQSVGCRFVIIERKKKKKSIEIRHITSTREKTPHDDRHLDRIVKKKEHEEKL
jgi:hypothetical protein